MKDPLNFDPEEIVREYFNRGRVAEAYIKIACVVLVGIVVAVLIWAG